MLTWVMIIRSRHNNDCVIEDKVTQSRNSKINYLQYAMKKIRLPKRISGACSCLPKSRPECNWAKSKSIKSEADNIFNFFT